MDNDKKGLSNRIHLIDPNQINGQASVGYGDPLYNIPPAHEDLSILVQLTTKSKARSILMTDASGSRLSNEGTTGMINFISGSSINGGRHLSTSYTELNGDIDEIEEGFGMTSIDINFSSSYAPMVTINFIDLKGGAIFRNGAKGKYGVFFKLPYPIFSLKVKGYYGKPVTYMLHLTKVNSKFNSQTGNFEMTANFVGYTYAILSDMLLGYLKAIGETTDGKNYIHSLRDQGDGDMMTLGELITKTKDIKSIIENIGTDNPMAVELGVIDNVMTKKIPEIETIITDFTASIGEKNLLQSNQKKGLVVIKDIDVDTGIWTDYIEKIKKSISEYDTLVANKNSLRFGSENTKFVNFVVITSLSSIDTDLSGKDDIIGAIKGAKISYNGKLYVYDTRPALDALNKKLSDVTLYKNDTTDAVAIQLKDKLQSSTKINSTIRTLVKIFCAHIEAFLGAIYDVSSKFKDPDRVKQLEKFMQKTSTSPDKRIDVNEDKKEIYPWPEYSEMDEEKYLGAAGVLDDPTQVPEIRFVEDLYQAMIKMGGIEQDTLNSMLEGNVTWNACNPLDTRALSPGIQLPYKRVSNPTPQNIAIEVLKRAIIFLSISNSKLSKKEIIAYAKSESENVYNSLLSTNNDNLRALSFKTISDFLALKIKDNSILVKAGNGYEYFGGGPKNDKSIISVEKTLDGDLLSHNEPYTINYNASKSVKPDKESVFLKVIEAADYDKFDSANTGAEVSEIQYDMLSKYIEPYLPDGDDLNFNSVGFNSMSGKFGIQEFIKINWSGDYNGFEDLPLAYIFYKDGGKYINGFAGKRSQSLEYQTDSYYAMNPINSSLGKEAMRHTWSNTTERLYSNKVRSNLGKGNELLAKIGSDAYPFVNFGVSGSFSKHFNISLFGSRFYYEQVSNHVKAFLFLHTFPWNGLTDNSGFSHNYGIFNKMEIINLFAYRAGFINVPSLWLAFIGGLLWRNSQAQDPIIYHINGDSVLPLIKANARKPSKSEYLLSLEPKQPMSFDSSGKYCPIEDTLLNLPDAAKKVFIEEFNKFVGGEWNEIRNELELMDSSKLNGTDWIKKCKSTQKNIELNITGYRHPNMDKMTQFLKKEDYTKNFNNIDNYQSYLIQSDTQFDNAGSEKEELSNNIFLEIKDNSEAVSVIKKAYTNIKWLANCQWGIWGLKFLLRVDSGDPKNIYINKNSIDKTGLYRDITVDSNDLNLYLKSFKEGFSGFTFDNKELVKATFGTTENDDIKLNIYKNIKSIYDKWIAGAESKENIIFSPDEVSGNKKPKLIDSFKFINRSFRDIGDKLFINPLIYQGLLIGKTDESFYTIFAKILSDNNMDFIPLPSFINFNDPKELISVFKPYPYMEAQNVSNTGPTFICMYIGQPSSKLDFEGDKSYGHPNDGFDFSIGNRVGEPNDFYNIDGDSNNPDYGAAFVVNYGHQNQNIFKDIQLDQSEFTETAEHLKIMDDLSSQKTQVSRTFAGQNLYNVYSVRSYKAEVEMMGNAMIQPMMYFQLNNIPLFHGAYVIINTKHSIKPNYMTTTFTGVRIRAVETPLITAEHLYSVILGDYKGEMKDGSVLSGIAPKLTDNYVYVYHNLLIKNPPNV